MNNCVIIQARMTSTRLPGKIMLPVAGKSLLEHQIGRVLKSKKISNIIIATTINSTDDVVVKLCENLNVNYFRGSENDVLGRYYYAAEKYKASNVIRITSDCPLYSPLILDEMLEKYENSDVDYLSNTLTRTYPRGLDTEIFTFKTLEKCFNESTEQIFREHVTSYIYKNPSIFKMKNYSGDVDNSYLRWTVDTAEDFELIKKIYDYFLPLNPNFDYEDIMQAYQIYPEWKKINSHIEQKKI